MATTKKSTPAKAGKAVKPLTDKARISRLLDGLQQVYGGSTTALDYRNPFELLIAVMLSAQTTDVYVNKVTPGLFARFPDAKAMAGADVAEVTQLIKGVSFFPTKAKNVIATSRILIEQYGGEVPGDWDALVKMPGVGRKTANVVVATAFNQPAIAVDTHVFRVSNRLGLATATTPEETERQLQKAIPRELWAESHHWLIWHGRKICKAPTPKCDVCFLTADCRYFQSLATAKPKATKAKAVATKANAAATKAKPAVAKAKPSATKAKSATTTKTKAAAATTKVADGSATSVKTARTHKAAATRAKGTGDGAQGGSAATPKARRRTP